MGKDSRIEWTHHTFNPWWGCVKVSAACDHCYAETWAKRLGESVWGPETPRRFFSDSHWKEPLKWNREAAAENTRRRVFCASMADVFENRPDLVGERLRLLELIAQTPNLDWLLLTKRIHLVRKQLPKGYEFPRNVWLGTTVENQASARKRIKYLLEFTSPAVRFLSCEPLLGPLDLSDYLVRGENGMRVDWVIAGGESGPGSRPMDPVWPANLQKQCTKARVPFHFKQWGHWAPVDQVTDVMTKHTAVKVLRQDGSEVSVAAIGKSKAGRTLAGKHWDQFPASAS
ncbi:phage Gp37/Gp68 family protein [Burkholderia sp. Bp9002]|nr:phage Gp37/Gp68 family protein [Burkholderia sp. Bp9002]